MMVTGKKLSIFDDLMSNDHEILFIIYFVSCISFPLSQTEMKMMKKVSFLYLMKILCGWGDMKHFSRII